MKHTLQPGDENRMSAVKTENAPPIPYKDEFRRKLVHLSSLWMPAAMCFLPRLPLCLAFGILFLLNLLVEHAYASGMPWLVRLYDRFFGGMLRNAPRKGQWIISGGPYVFASACLTLALFPREIAACGMAVMLLGDTAAALVGRRFGRTRIINGKSLEGVIAFLIAGYAGCALFLLISGMPPVFYLAGAIGIFPAAAAELFEKQLRLDDNFTIPVITGAVLACARMFL